MDKDLHEKILSAANLLKESTYAVAFTGAGISTASGIPDFRSPGTGLWERDDPFKVASLTAFQKHPEIFFKWIKPNGEYSMFATKCGARGGNKEFYPKLQFLKSFCRRSDKL